MRDMFSGHALIVEDNPINQVVLEAQLKILGFTVDKADNGLKALELIEPDKYLIIFMDIQMPVMGGIECTENIRNSIHAQVNSIPVIAVTANVTREYQESCDRVGMNGFVKKPLNVDELIDQISNVLPSVSTA